MHVPPSLRTLQIFVGLFIPLITISILKQSIKGTPERKKRLSFKTWTICASLTPFAAIIIGKYAYVHACLCFYVYVYE